MKKEIIIYHGSEKIIEKPIYGFGKRYNDYGVGFYCTEYEELAKEWACDEFHGGYANKYKLDLTDLKILNLNGPDFCVIHWISILLKNRIFTIDTEIGNAAKDYILTHFPVNTADYDIIIGYRADDSYFSYARDFLHNGISVKRLKQVMKLGNLGNQIVLISEKAFSKINYIESVEAPKEIHLPRRKHRDELARYEYLNSRKEITFNKEDLLIMDIMREEIKKDDPRLQ